MVDALEAFDESPVENFHSVLRARTRETDTAEQMTLKAKEIFEKLYISSYYMQHSKNVTIGYTKFMFLRSFNFWTKCFEFDI